MGNNSNSLVPISNSSTRLPKAQVAPAFYLNRRRTDKTSSKLSTEGPESP